MIDLSQYEPIQVKQAVEREKELRKLRRVDWSGYEATRVKLSHLGVIRRDDQSRSY